jgi:hypothetical protein
MKKLFLIVLTILFVAVPINSQSGREVKDKNIFEESLDKTAGINDRAGGTHNASNIGLFFENRGKLYPRRLTQGPSGEFPINSGMHYIYRVNPMVGVPGNVIQGRFTTNEEWEAVGGFHNSDSAQIAFSDNPNTWHPELGWPVKDKEGNPIILSDQDSYCVYSDSNNAKDILGVVVAQTGYAFGVKFARDILFYKYDITNVGSKDLEKLYFNLYCDIDVGNVSGGDPEYADDRIGFEKERNLLYFYDDGISNEWPGGKTGHFGIMFLKTPEVNGVEPGITDMHYNLYDDDIDVDSILYGIMSSDPNLYNSSIGQRYFHLGNNTELNYDDPNTIPTSGLDMLANIASGPYTLRVGDTLTFITAFVAGWTYAEMIAAAEQAQNTINANFELPKPPSRPKLFGMSGDKKSILYWDDSAELSKDNFTGEYDFEGYRIYRSRDKGITWSQIAEYDIINSVGGNKGIQYSYVDTTVINGFEYWYSITAFDRGDELIESLESPIGNTLDAPNTVSVIPRSDALGRSPVSSQAFEKLGTGKSNYELKIDPIDDERLAGSEYLIEFSYTSRKEKGNLETGVEVIVTDSTRTKPHSYAISFTSPSNFDLSNLTTGEVIRTGYPYPPGGRDVVVTNAGITIRLSDQPDTPQDFLPEQGDLITVNFSVAAVKNKTVNVINPRPFLINKPQATNDGVIFTLHPPEIINQVSRIGGTDNVDITFSVGDASLVKDNLYIITIEGNGIASDQRGFVSLTVRDTALIAKFDTLYNSSTFNFHGVTGRIQFPSANPPSEGNKFSLKTVKPIEPNIQDKYQFKIEGSKVSKESISENLKRIKVVPNPYIVSSLYEPEFGELRREPLRQIQFINLPPECTIYIFTVDADLVKTINHSSTSGTATWDLRAEGGREIAPGMYIYVVKTADIEYVERFAVIK